MVVLKKFKAATLIETLTASVIIIIVFMVASLILNNVFEGTIKRDFTGVKTRMLELKYLVLHNKIKMPYAEDFGKWEIEIVTDDKEQIKILSSKEGIFHENSFKINNN